MAEPVTYEQILRELAQQRELKPWETVTSPPPAAPAPAPTPYPQYPQAAPDPFAQAQQREGLMEGLQAAFGTMANPETQMAAQGRPPKPGLIQMIMGLMR